MVAVVWCGRALGREFAARLKVPGGARLGSACDKVRCLDEAFVFCALVMMMTRVDKQSWKVTSAPAASLVKTEAACAFEVVLCCRETEVVRVRSAVEMQVDSFLGRDIGGGPCF